MSKTHQENPLLNIIVNIALPVLILNKLSPHFGPLKTLILALSFPIAYGIWDLYRRKKINFISLLGIINVSITGSLALFGLNGFWFSVKEACFPALVGLFVFISGFTKKPFIESLLLNPSIMHLELIHSRLEEAGRWKEFRHHLKISTWMLSLSFLVSSAINYTLAQRIFIPLDSILDETTRSLQLNQQIAQMTTWAMAVTFIPSLIMLSGILWYLLRGISQVTGLANQDILKN